MDETTTPASENDFDQSLADAIEELRRVADRLERSRALFLSRKDD